METLFQLVRKEDVAVWLGAGTSLNAGFPSASKLKDILIENLSKTEKEMIDVNLPLPKLAEEFYRLKNNNRNTLIKVLNRTFLNTNSDSKTCHQELSMIPHFKTIITTNYDTLIEDAFSYKGQVVFLSKHIPYLENGKTHIFKVHGDLKDPDSIIITESDYNNFFKLESEYNIYWTVVKERLSTKNILFLGYNIDDPNVSVIFDKISEELGENRKECFLVAPDLKQHKIDYLTRKGIHYINSTAEKVVKDLITNIKENIIEDLEKGKTSADTFKDFLSNIELLPSLKTENRKFKVQSVQGTSENIKGKINLTMRCDPEFSNELNDFFSGNKFGNLEIPKEKLINADFRYGGIKFPNFGKIGKLEFKSIPRVETFVDIQFEDKSEFTEIPVKIFGNEPIVEIHIELKSANLKINADFKKHHKVDFTFNFKHNEVCRNLKEEIELFSFLHKLGSGMKFKVFVKSGEIYPYAFPPMTAILNESNYFLYYFDSLKQIEHLFGIRFSNFNLDSITETSQNKITEILAAGKHETIDYNYDDELTITLTENYPNETIDQLKEVHNSEAPVAVFQNSEEIIELHGQKINVGYKKVEFVEPFVLNLKAIIERTENIVKIKSNKRKIQVSYSKNNIEDENLRLNN